LLPVIDIEEPAPVVGPAFLVSPPGPSIFPVSEMVLPPVTLENVAVPKSERLPLKFSVLLAARERLALIPASPTTKLRLVGIVPVAVVVKFMRTVLVPPSVISPSEPNELFCPALPKVETFTVPVLI